MALEITCGGFYWAKHRKYGFLVVMEVYSHNYDDSLGGDARDWLHGKCHSMPNYQHIDRLESDFAFIERIDDPGAIKPSISGSFAPPIGFGVKYGPLASCDGRLDRGQTGKIDIVNHGKAT
jgi:hypothetical protein